MREKTSAQADPGYRGFDGYPVAYQAADFPAYGDEIRMTGNNQAFFFVSGVKVDGKIVDVELNTAALKKLFGNILSQGTTSDKRPLVCLQIDADVFEHSEGFVEKYQALRSEPEQQERERLLGKEAELIRTFVNSGGIIKLAKEVLQENARALKGEAELPEGEIDQLAFEFLEKNFKLEGILTQEPLKFATWEIKSKQEGTCCTPRI